VIAGTTATEAVPSGCGGKVHSMNPELWKMTSLAVAVPTLMDLTVDGVSPKDTPYTET
jgi:hypothetical protein